MTRPGRPGYYPLDLRYGHIVAAGVVLWCAACQTQETTEIPRLQPVLYSRACERFLELHRGCADVHRGAA